MNMLKKKLSEKLGKNGGFTLVEMLIVVAIIAILVAVSIPLVGTALRKAREATDEANMRAAKAEATIIVLNHQIDSTKANLAEDMKYDNVLGKFVPAGTDLECGTAGYNKAYGETGDPATTADTAWIEVDTYNSASGEFTLIWATA